MKLVDVTKENWNAVILLTTNEDGKHTLGERYVASNAYSMVQSSYENGWITKAIEHEGVILGFTMFGLSEEDNTYEVCRFMIDRSYQGKGYGKQALAMILEEMIKLFSCKEIYLWTSPDNARGIHIYEKAGFVATGKIDDDEELYKLNV